MNLKLVSSILRIGGIAGERMSEEFLLFFVCFFVIVLPVLPNVLYTQVLAFCVSTIQALIDFFFANYFSDGNRTQSVNHLRIFSCC